MTILGSEPLLEEPLHLHMFPSRVHFLSSFGHDAFEALLAPRDGRKPLSLSYAPQRYTVVRRGESGLTQGHSSVLDDMY